MDRLEEWRIFVTVASARSFVAAAKSLGRSPQATTRAVASLEGRLRTRLLHRTTRSVSLTTDGERYLERGRRAIAELDLLESVEGDNAADESGQALHGTVTITAPVLFGQLHVVPIITKMLIKHPALSVRLSLFDRVVSLAEEGVDLAVRIGALPDSSLRARLVGHVRMLVCASPKYIDANGKPRDPLSLVKHSCIAWTATTPIAERWSFRRRRAEGGKEKSVTIHPRFMVNSGQAAIDAALAHVGIVRVLSYQVDRLIEQEKLVPLLRPFEPEPIPIHLVQLPGIQARIVGLFVGELAEALQQVIPQT